MKYEKLSMIILPSLLTFMKTEGNISKEEFETYIWWAVKGLC